VLAEGRSIEVAAAPGQRSALPGPFVPAAGRALAHPADDDLQGHQRQGCDAAASAADEHAHGRHRDGTDVLPGRDPPGHQGIHGRDHPRDPGRGQRGSLQPPAAAAGRRVTLDPAQLGGEDGHAADVSVGILLRPARIAA